MPEDLNRRSAELVMGFTEGFFRGDIWIYKDLNGNWIQWTPLTDLNQCFMVVEKMRELGWFQFILEYFHELTWYDPPLPTRWCVKFWNFDVPQSWATADTPNEAILTAALAAKGG